MLGSVHVEAFEEMLKEVEVKKKAWTSGPLSGKNMLGGFWKRRMRFCSRTMKVFMEMGLRWSSTIWVKTSTGRMTLDTEATLLMALGRSEGDQGGN